MEVSSPNSTLPQTHLLMVESLVLLGEQSIRFQGWQRYLVILIGRLGLDLLLEWNLVLSCLLPVDCWLGISRLLRRVGISIHIVSIKLIVVLSSGLSI